MVSKHSSTLTAEFEVRNLGDWQTSTSFGNIPYKNWGLWEYDVVELFIGTKSHYLELQVSPLGQGFILEIFKPRQLYFTPFQYEFHFSSSVQGESWKASLSLDLEQLKFTTDDEIHYNAFAILGGALQREYYALNINQEETPNFHRPDLFLSL